MISFYAFLQLQFNLFSIFTILEIVTIKYWLKFIRKKVVAMDDEIIVFVLTLQNLVMSSLYALVKIVIGDGDRNWGFSLRVPPDTCIEVNDNEP